MKEMQNLPIRAVTPYWQHRAKEMSKEIIARKRLASGCTQGEATDAFRKWILETVHIQIDSWETLKIEECTAIVAFLHRHTSAFKSRPSIAP